MQIFFFFNDTATTEIYTLSLHDALPICPSVFSLPAVIPSTSAASGACSALRHRIDAQPSGEITEYVADRKSTRLNSSHSQISYAVFCLKKKKNHMLSSPTCTCSRHHCSD